MQKWIQFDYQGGIITLQGILPTESIAIPEISGEQFHKLDKGNAI
jgi:hypothetical protein